MEDYGQVEARLAAIMFTDIAGYSRLMEEDEDRTIALLKEHNRILFPLIESAGGRIVDAIGDGLLLLFPSVREAAKCAIAIQDAIAEYDSQVEAHRRFQLRVGIHLGEIREDDGRIFGAGVNEAARILPFARPGGICISEDVHRHVRNKVDRELVSIGVQELKNISRPIGLFEIVTGHEPPDSRRGTATSAPASGDEAGDDAGEEARERLLRQREKLARRRMGLDADDSGSAIERGAYRIAERVIDAAIAKWDSMPEDMKKKAIAEISSDGKSHTEASVRKENKKKNAEAGGSLSAGIVFGTGFGIGFFHFGLTWMIVPFVLLGVFPFLNGVRTLVERSRRRRRELAERPRHIESALLKAASDLGGTVTVVQLAGKTGLSLDEVQDTLDRMAARGYVAQEIEDSGLIVYHFR